MTRSTVGAHLSKVHGSQGNVQIAENLDKQTLADSACQHLWGEGLIWGANACEFAMIIMTNCIEYQTKKIFTLEIWSRFLSFLLMERTQKCHLTTF